MIYDKAARETLRYLFSEYLKAPAVVFSIGEIIRKHRLDGAAFTDYLVERKWIREPWIYSNNDVTCRITVSGIEEINPEYVRNKLRQLVGGLGESGGSQPLLEILQFKIEEYAIALDVIRQLETIGLVHTRQDNHNIVVSLTDQGWRFFEKSHKTFFTLMAVA